MDQTQKRYARRLGPRTAQARASAPCSRAAIVVIGIAGIAHLLA